MKLSLKDLEQCVDLPATTIERWIRQGRIPVHKIDQYFVFKKDILSKWATTHNLPFNLPSDKIESGLNLSEATLLSAMQYGGVHYDIDATHRDQALFEILEMISDLTQEDRTRLYQLLKDRENLSSTGIGKGVAMPHPRTPLKECVDEPLIGTFFLKAPIPYDSVDDKPVFVMFLLLCPTVQIHLQLLSKLSFCIRNNSFVQFLKSKPPAESLFGKISDFEIKLDT